MLMCPITIIFYLTLLFNLYWYIFVNLIYENMYEKCAFDNIYLITLLISFLSFVCVCVQKGMYVCMCKHLYVCLCMYA